MVSKSILGRLRPIILECLTKHPGSSSGEIVEFIESYPRDGGPDGYKHYGLDSKTIGFYLPRFFRNDVTWSTDPVTKKRVFYVRDDLEGRVHG